MSAPWGGWGDPAAPHAGSPGDGPVDPYAGEPAAPVPTYNPYANPGSWEPAQYLPRTGVPGTVLAGSIVAYVFAALLFVSGLFLMFSGSVLPDSVDALDPTVGDGPVALFVAGFGNLLATGLLVAAGVTTSLRRPVGLLLTVVANGLVVALAVYWVVLYPHGFVAVWAVVHTLLALGIAGLVVLPPGNRAWLTGAPGTGPSPVAAGPQPYPTDRYGRPFGS